MQVLSSRTLLKQLSDKSLTFNIRNSINADEDLVSNSHINVTTVNGIVLLTGSVPSAEDKNWVHEQCAKYADVRQIVNGTSGVKDAQSITYCERPAAENFGKIQIRY